MTQSIDSMCDSSYGEYVYQEMDVMIPKTFANTRVYNQLQRDRARATKRKAKVSKEGAERRKTSMDRKKLHHRVYRPNKKTIRVRTPKGEDYHLKMPYEPFFQRRIRVREEDRLKHGVNTSNLNDTLDALERLHRITRLRVEYYDGLFDGRLKELLGLETQSIVITDCIKGHAMRTIKDCTCIYVNPLMPDEIVIDRLEELLRTYAAQNNLQVYTARSKTAEEVHSQLYKHFFGLRIQYQERYGERWSGQFRYVFGDKNSSELAKITLTDSDDNEVAWISIVHHTKYHFKLEPIFSMYEIVTNGLPKGVLEKMASIDSYTKSEPKKELDRREPRSAYRNRPTCSVRV